MTSATSGPLVARRGWRDAWAWMRWDVPTRIVLLIAAPLIWIAVAGIDPVAIGLRFDIYLRDWLLIALLAVGAGFVSLAYRRWLWRPRTAPDRSALALELPFFVVLNPVAEELFFRGAALFGLANLVGMPWAIAITSVVFGVHHALARFPVSFLVLGTLGGAMFGIVTAYYWSIVPAIVMHAAADFAIFVAAGPMARRAWANDPPQGVEPPPVDRLAAPTP
ncbi:MAG: CPBP family intramembrane metalloprotease [Chloroflexi bacterium]|nr:CPBP family intramembrane metalloprotease [Chloroflexota bacterium]